MADNLGGKVATRVASVVTRAKLDTLNRSRGLFVATGMALQEEFFRLTGSELVRTFGPVYQAIADQAPAAGWIKPTAQFLAQGHGQLSTLIGVSGISSGFGQGVGSVVANDLNPITTAIIRAHPNSLLSVPDLAAGVAKDLLTLQEAEVDAAGQGIRPDRFQTQVALAATVWSSADILDLVNRGLMTEAHGLASMRRAGIADDAAQDLMQLRHQLVTVADLADMQVRGVITAEQGRGLAALVGYTPEQYDRYALITGSPPDLQSLFLAWRRGIITEADVDRGIRQSRLRDEWINAAKDLRWVPLDFSEVVAGVVQNHIAPADAYKMAEEVGLKPGLFDIAVANHGNPPSPGEAVDWFNRGLIDRATFDQIFREGHTKDKYIPAFFNARFRKLTMAEIRLLYRDGAFTRDEAIAHLQTLGFDAADAGSIVVGASALKTAKARELTITQVTSLLTDQLITSDQATSLLTAMGWSDQEATWILDLADLGRMQRQITAAVNQVRSRYVGRKADVNATSAALDSLGVATDARDQYIALWDIERSVVTKTLTEAQTIAAVKATLISPQDASDRLQAMGYGADDALILLGIAKIDTTGLT
jgi:hypothetical protein